MGAIPLEKVIAVQQRTEVKSHKLIQKRKMVKKAPQIQKLETYCQMIALMEVQARTADC